MNKYLEKIAEEIKKDKQTFITSLFKGAKGGASLGASFGAIPRTKDFITAKNKKDIFKSIGKRVVSGGLNGAVIGAIIGGGLHGARMAQEASIKIHKDE